MRPRHLLRSFAAMALGAALPLLVSAADGQNDPLTWSESHRAFFSDGAGLLLSDEQRSHFLSLDEGGRTAFVESFLEDPIADTELNELTEGIRRRQAMVRGSFASVLDQRAQLYFLHGAPDARLTVDCDQVFRALEIWTYARFARELVLFQPLSTEPFRLWLPLDSKRALYRREMEYWLDQYHELRQFITGRRFDLQLCRMAKRIDDITGVGGLFAFKPDRPTNDELLAYLEPPKDLVAWARRAAATDVDLGGEALIIHGVTASFPERDGQRIVTRLTLNLPTAEGLQTFQEEAGEPEFRLQLSGVVEHQGRVFDQFRIRYVVPQAGEPEALALVLDRAFRPGLSFLFRLRIEDEIGGRVGYVIKAVIVPDQPIPVEDPPVPAQAVLALGDQMAERRIPGRDDIVLVPPETDLVFGLWRAEVLVSGERIVEVRFLVDDRRQFTRKRPPFTAEVRLSKFPTEQLVRVEGYDSEGVLVASDDLVLNQQRGELRVRITSPPRGTEPSGEVLASAEVVVPEERRLRKVEFQVNGALQAVREQPPWRAKILVPESSGPEDVSYLTVTAELDNGTRAEDVRFLHMPSYMDEIEVDLVELYTTVTDRNKRPVAGLSAEDFQVSEDGRRQKIVKFEVVEDLPLTIGITIDTSGSMIEALGEARQAAVDFLSNIVTPKDRSFAVRFADRPELMMPRTSDVGAVAKTMEGIVASGSTALHDAIVTSLYYFRGVRGRRAMVLLSDGDDTASTIPFREALEYARRSGVAIYAIGLNIGRLQVGVRNKLSDLAKETGGRAFFIGRATELEGAYEEIERELRSQYLVAYSSDQQKTGESTFRTVEVKVRGGKLKARTIRGYYP